jgi:hypothetical protein
MADGYLMCQQRQRLLVRLRILLQKARDEILEPDPETVRIRHNVSVLNTGTRFTRLDIRLNPSQSQSSTVQLVGNLVGYPETGVYLEIISLELETDHT